jgi:type-F conjugative transfer system pilin assembly protein TrbC
MGDMMRFKSTLMVAMLTLLPSFLPSLSTVATGQTQTPTVPTVEQITEQQRKAQAVLQQTQHELKRQQTQNIQPKVNIEAILKQAQQGSTPNVPLVTPEQLNRLANGTDKRPTAIPPTQANGQAYLFVSTSMPAASLKTLLTQAGRANIPVILRGMVDGSIQKTFARMHQYGKETGAAVQIDPRLFDRFDITTVPSVVVVQENTPLDCQQNCPALLHGKVVGDAPLDYALSVIEREQPALSTVIAGYQQALRQTGHSAGAAK